MRLAALIGLGCLAAQAHDPITTKLTWNLDVAPIVNARCARCHHPGGAAFSLLTYREARPWAKAIAEEVLERRMPPWGAVKGFGEFRNDEALSQGQLDLIAQWVDGGAPEGEGMAPQWKASTSRVAARGRQIVVEGEYTVRQAMALDGILPKAGASMQVTAAMPDGRIEPLLWLHGYDAKFGHPFLLRVPLRLPAGTVIRGVGPGASIVLLVAR